MAEQKTHKVTLIPGDGIGPEVTQAVVRIIEATGVRFEWERFAAGAEAFEIFGEYIPAALYQSIERNGVALKGPVATPIGCLLYTSPSPRDRTRSRMPSS